MILLLVLLRLSPFLLLLSHFFRELLCFSEAAHQNNQLGDSSALKEQDWGQTAKIQRISFSRAQSSSSSLFNNGIYRSNEKEKGSPKHIS